MVLWRYGIMVLWFFGFRKGQGVESDVYFYTRIPITNFPRWRSFVPQNAGGNNDPNLDLAIIVGVEKMVH